MRLIEVIDNPKRTRAELDFFINLYNLKKYNFAEEKLNKILDDLKWFSKSRSGTYNFCPKQLFYGYIACIKPINVVDIFTFGKDGHKVVQYFYRNTAPNDILINSINATEYFYKILITLFDKYVEKENLALYKFRNNYELMFKMFAEYENARLQNIKRLVGLNKETIERYFYPLYTELYLANKTYRIRGIIDAIFLQPDETLLILDYKSGKPKDLSDKWKFLNVCKELIFYKILIEESGTFIFEVKGKGEEDEEVEWVRPIEELKPMKVSYIQMLFFKDPFHSRAIHVNELKDPATGRELQLDVIQGFANYWNDLESGNLPFANFRSKETCISYCGYFLKACFKENDDFKNIRDFEEKVYGAKT